MAVDLDERPGSSVDSHSGVGGFNKNTPQGVYDNEFDAIANRFNEESAPSKSVEPEDLEEKEKANSDPYSSASLDNEKKTLDAKTGSATDNAGVSAVPYTGKEPTGLKRKGLQKIGAIMSGSGKKSRLTVAIVGFVLAGGGLAISANAPSLALLHISEVLTKEIGGISSKVVRHRSGKLYSRHFFFREDGAFDGYKNTNGILGWRSNVKSTNLLDEMKSKGFDFTFDAKGKITSISGLGETAKNATELDGLFAKRSVLWKSINDAYPEESFMWRSKRMKLASRRLGLDRSNWIYHSKLVKYLDAKEASLKTKFNFSEKLKAGFRAKLTKYGLVTNIADTLGDTVEGAADDVAAGATNAEKALTKDIISETNSLTDKIEKNILGDIEQTGEDILQSSLKQVDDVLLDSAPSVAQAVAAPKTKIAQVTCASIALEREVEYAASVYRYKGLVKYSGLLMPLLGAIKSGNMKSSEIAGLANAVVYSRDKKTGALPSDSTALRNLFNRTKNKVSDSEIRKAAPTTKLLSWMTKIRSKFFDKFKSTCRVVTNPVVGLVATVAETGSRIGEGFITGATLGLALPITGSDLVVATAVSVAQTVAFEVAKKFLLPIVATAIAGVTCNMGESGVLVGACLVSSTTALISTTSAISGMHPLKNKSVAYYENELKNDRIETYASMSIWDRYFSTSNTYSLASSAIIKSPVGLSGFANSGSSFIGSLSGLLSGKMLFATATSGVQTAYADAATNPDDIAKDPFGYPILGVDPEAMDNPEYDLENTTKFLIGDLNNPNTSTYNLYLTMDGAPNLEGLDIKTKTDSVGNVSFVQEPLPEGKRKDKIKEVAQKIEKYRLQCKDVDELESKGKRSNQGNVLVDENGNESSLCSKDLDDGSDFPNNAPVLRYYQMFRFDNNLGKAQADAINESYSYDTGQADIDDDGTDDSISDGVEPTSGADFAGAEDATGNNKAVPSCKTIVLDTSIVDNVDSLIKAAKADGINLCGWGGRSNADQIRLRIAHCGSSNFAIYQMKARACKPPTARPGYSMHEKFLAIDFTCSGGSVIRGGGCDKWLLANAGKYGLKNLPSEAWHYSTNGR